jgi:hypothetical protein
MFPELFDDRCGIVGEDRGKGKFQDPGSKRKGSDLDCFWDLLWESRLGSNGAEYISEKNHSPQLFCAYGKTSYVLLQ